MYVSTQEKYVLYCVSCKRPRKYLILKIRISVFFMFLKSKFLSRFHYIIMWISCVFFMKLFSHVVVICLWYFNWQFCTNDGDTPMSHGCPLNGSDNNKKIPACLRLLGIIDGETIAFFPINISLFQQHETFQTGQLFTESCRWRE